LSTEFQGGVLAELTRNGLVESIHSGHLIMLNADGSVYKTKGNVDLPIFPRSSVKCMQASAKVICNVRWINHLEMPSELPGARNLQPDLQ
jgi:L-asparaginase II